jgi:prepilin signal peptidase PulO-like enzyme (type II secretory pathway)
VSGRLQVKKLAPIIKLKTNLFFNIVKLLVISFLLVIFAIVAKVFPYYHLETLILAIVIGTIVWLYRLRYKGKLEYTGTLMSAVMSAVMRINVFNHKVVRITVEQGTEKLVFRYSGQSDSMDFEDRKLAFKMRMLTEFRKDRTCLLELLDN